jgi:secreted metalloprotease
MTKSLALTCLLSTTITAALATQPVRRILVSDRDGKISSVALDSLGLSRPGGGEMHCPYQAPQRATRSFHTISEDGLGRLGQTALGTLPSIGKQRIPVVLVEFADISFNEKSTIEGFNQQFNAPGYRQNKSSRGSVRDYFVDQSYGRFTPEFDVLGKVRLSRPRSFYGANIGNSKNGNIYEFYNEALDLAQKQGMNFTPFVNGNAVPLVVFIFAGEGEHNSKTRGSEDFIWAHYKAEYTRVNGVAFNSYFVGNELTPVYKRENGQVVMQDGYPVVDHVSLDGIGVLCHELGHALGLPDFYSTSGSPLDYQTPDLLDVMDYGQYWNDGYAPMGYSAYERACLGWLQPEELKVANGQLTIASLSQSSSTHPKAYLLRNPDRSAEYYILENRQPSRWFPKGIGQGMLFYHIDYDADNWALNAVNTNQQHLRCSIVRADGIWQSAAKAKHLDEYRGDFFPGLSEAKEFSVESTPRFFWYKGTSRHRFYGMRTNEDSTMTFSYDDYSVVGLPQSQAVTQDAETPLYDLSGRRVSSPLQPNQIYIGGGKKRLSPSTR